MPLHNPHDAFIKAGLGEPAQMAAFLQAYLPPELTATVDWNSLRRAENDFLDEQLHARHADLLFTAQFQGEAIFFHLLFEHQRTADHWMPLRLLTYQLRIWEKFRSENPNTRHLPPILPIVFFQDRKEWAPSPQFRDLFNLPQGLDPNWLPYLPDFRHATINLSALQIGQLHHNLALRVMLKVMDAILDPDPVTSFKTGLQALLDLENAPDQITFLRICLTYLTKAGNTLDRQTLHTIIKDVKSSQLKEEAMTIAEQLIQEGRQEGRQEGERLLLERLLVRKFGELEYTVIEKLNHAGQAELEKWGERILDAKTLNEVFAE